MSQGLAEEYDKGEVVSAHAIELAQQLAQLQSDRQLSWQFFEGPFYH